MSHRVLSVASRRFFSISKAVACISHQTPALLNSKLRLATHGRLGHTAAGASQGPNKRKTLFFVYAPDIPNSHRYDVREQHLKDIQPLMGSRVVSVAGMCLNPDKPVIRLEDGKERNNAVASILIIEAKTLEEAREIIVSDVYWKTGVWDKEKVTIHPFVAATQFP